MFDVSPAEIAALWEVLIVNIVLSGDNAIVVGLAAAGVAPALRTRVIFYGIGIAVVMRIVFAIATLQLLAIPGVKLAGGLLLLWVCWRFAQDLRTKEPGEALPDSADGKAASNRLWHAVTQIAVADLSMSLDNVLAVASAAMGYQWVLIAGLVMSVLFMAVAANLIARLLDRHHWIGWLGLAVIFYVAIEMLWDGCADFGWVGPWPLH
ncbi:MAG: TerC family protein [Alphaproteobacteria bacterium]|nr:TerC family protein [Alphaproteobacteria bacterium]